MKPMNFPARRLRRQIRANDGHELAPDNEQAMAQARNTHTKIRRTARKTKLNG